MLEISPFQETLIACAVSGAVSAAAAFGGAWTVQGWRYGERIADMNTAQALQLAQANADALERTKNMQGVKDEAIRQAEDRAKVQAVAAANARADAGRLRDQLTAADKRISTASRAAVDQYAATLGIVFGQCVEEYRGMAESAQGHSDDARLMLEAWPSAK